MGKRIIIKGADFSANGFSYKYVTKEYTKLQNYNYNDAEYPLSGPDSWYTCSFLENTDIGPDYLSLRHTNSANSASLGVSAEDYTHIKIEGFGNSLSAFPYLSCPIIACVSGVTEYSQGYKAKVLGGIIVSTNSEYDSIFLNAGWTRTIRPEDCTYPSTFEMDIPTGTVSIYTSMVIV